MKHYGKHFRKGRRGINLEVDRIEPKELYSPKNCILACYPCNNAKSDVFSFEEFKEIGKIIQEKSDRRSYYKVAKTVELKTIVEDYVRQELGKSYPGHKFQEKALPLRKKKDGTFAVHKFDAVSEDNTIVASIKSHSWLTSGGNLPSGKIGQIYQSLYFLNLTNARTKLLILTDRKAYDGFLKLCDGKIAEDIEIKVCQLTHELQQTVIEVPKESESRDVIQTKTNIVGLVLNRLSVVMYQYLSIHDKLRVIFS